VYLKAETIGGVKAIKKLEIEVCGAETIILLPPATTYEQVNGIVETKETISSTVINTWY
jgi:hypothetical protein